MKDEIERAIDRLVEQEAEKRRIGTCSKCGGSTFWDREKQVAVCEKCGETFSLPQKKTRFPRSDEYEWK